MRVVLDTNVLVSALLFKKQLVKIEILIKTGVITPCFVVSTFKELQNVLNYEKLQTFIKISNTSAEEIIETLIPYSLIMSDPKIVPTSAVDPSDNYILAAAKVSRAEFIITGDKPLLALKQFQNIPVISPRQFLEKIRD